MLSVICAHLSARTIKCTIRPHIYIIYACRQWWEERRVTVLSKRRGKWVLYHILVNYSPWFLIEPPPTWFAWYRTGKRSPPGPWVSGFLSPLTMGRPPSSACYVRNEELLLLSWAHHNGYIHCTSYRAVMRSADVHELGRPFPCFPFMEQPALCIGSGN